MFYFNEKCKNQKILEIVSDHSSCGRLMQSNFSDNMIICMPLCLSLGDLSNLKYYDRNSIKIVYNDVSDDLNFKRDMDKFIKLLEKAEKIRIWSSHLDDDSYLLLTYLSNFIDTKNAYVIYADDYNNDSYSIGCMNINELYELMKSEKKIVKNDIEFFKYEWNKVLQINSEYRYIQNSTIKNISFDYFYNDILNILKNQGEMLVIKLITSCMRKKVINNASDILYKYIINDLISKGKIKIIKKGENHPKVLSGDKDTDYYNVIKIAL